MDPPPDSTLGQYIVGKELGSGTFGKVKLATHSLTGTKVAFKYINKSNLRNSKMKLRVQREIDFLKQLDHPHIIKLYEVINTPTSIIMVIEYANEEMFNYIAERGRLPEKKVRKLFQQIMSALEYSHSLGIVHRDLKPENILLKDGDIKITDFGLSSQVIDGDFLRTSCGSPNYAAPEVINGLMYAGTEIDVWSCGVILYVMLCGRLPFEDEIVPRLFAKIRGGHYHLPSHLSPETRNLIAGMLMVDPVKRLTVREILKHPWVAEDIAPSLAQTSRPVLDSLSSLVSPKGSANKVIKGLGELDDSIVSNLAGKLGVSEVVVLDALDQDTENAVKVAYRIIRDEKPNNKGPKDEHHAAASSHAKIQPILIPTIPANPNRGNDYYLDYDGDGDEQDDDDDDTFGEPIDWSEENSFAVLNTSLVGDGGEASPLPLFGPRRAPASSQSKMPSPTQRTSKSGNARNRRAGIKQPRWHFGIRSGNPAMEVIHEIYRTLKDLGIEWREKGGEWSVNGASDENGVPHVPQDGEASHEASDVFSREAIDIFFVETRWRVDNIMVRIDLQLYQVDDTSYLVDFRNVGYHRISTSGAATNSTVSPSTTPLSGSILFDNPLNEGDPSYKTKADGSGVLSPFLFMDCAHKLILELAGGG